MKSVFVISLHLFTLGQFYTNSASGSPENKEVEHLQFSFQAEMEEANSPVNQLEERYVEELKKLEAEAKKAGDLEQTILIKEEISDFSGRRSRDYQPYPHLSRLREIYEKESSDLQPRVEEAQLEVRQAYAANFDQLRTKLTRANDIAGALEADKIRKAILAEIASALENRRKNRIEEVLWSLETKADYDLIQKCQAEKQDDGWILSSPERHMTWLQSDKSIEVPFVIRARAGTDSLDLRFGFQGTWMVIFNLHSDVKDLMIRGGKNAQKGTKFPGKGFLEQGKLHDIEIEVLEDRIRVSANGEFRAESIADMKGEKGSVEIGPAFGSVITLEQFKVIRP